GVVIIKAQRFRSQERNRQDALSRLQSLVRAAVAVAKKRKPTRPSRAAKQRRLEAKAKRGAVKALRKPVGD
ncbi:MAG TPA: peptide chain release factor-like protein, partial [Mariprofundaceae bacterium]|nr:peptide chain release factor-like protein [Mariprofundaceae bacterium]